jgi:hypothetical protein
MLQYGPDSARLAVEPGPASSGAGVREGDRLTAVDGISIKGLPPELVEDLLRASLDREPGGSLTLLPPEGSP